MDYFEKFLKFINENNLINNNDSILISFSGGPDSIFLTKMLIKLSKNNKIKLGMFHLNHLLRGKSSNNDEKFSIEFAKKHSIPIFVEKQNIKNFAKLNKMSIEEAGRFLRYKLLHEIAEKNRYQKIATAHNFDDQIETFFLNIFRGRAIRSFECVRVRYGKIIRPILNFSKKEILKYLKINNLNFVIDESNFEKYYLRNKIRLQLIPEIEKYFNENFKSHIFNLTFQMKDLNEYIDENIEKIFNKIVIKEGDGVKVLLKNLPENKFILTEILKKIFHYFNCFEYNKKILEKLITFIQDNKGKFIFKNVEFSKEYDAIFIQPTLAKTLSIDNIKLSITEVEKGEINFLNKPKYTEFVDKDKLLLPLKIRFFHNGDRFQPLGFKSEIKLKKFFINQKVPARLRHKIPLVIDKNGNIIWVAGYRISEKVKIDKNSSNIVKIQINDFSA